MFRAGLRRARTLGRRFFALKGAFFQVGRKTKAMAAALLAGLVGRIRAGAAKRRKINVMFEHGRDSGGLLRELRPCISNYKKCKL
jgi:hypothetical protein